MKKSVKGTLAGIAMMTAFAAQPMFSQAAAGGGAVRVVMPGTSFLGVGVQEIDVERAKALNLKETHGVEVTRVEEDGPAAKAGLKTGDVVVEYNGQRVEGTEQFIRMVHETPVGRQVKMTVSRSGASQTVTATIGSRKAGAVSGRGFVMPRIEIPEFQMPDIPQSLMSWRSGALGVQAEAVDSQLAEYFGVKDGVLVRSVIKGSAAEKAGVKAGDVIVKVDNTHVANPREVSSAVRAAVAKGTFPITVVRERKEMTMSVTINDDHSHSAEPMRPRQRQIRFQVQQL